MGSGLPGATTLAATSTFSEISEAVMGPLSFSETSKLCAMLTTVAVAVLKSDMACLYPCIFLLESTGPAPHCRAATRFG